jgi:hypothetical protein
VSLNRLRARKNGLDAERAALMATPIAWRDEDGAYVGVNGEVWLYRAFPQTPLEWEDATTRLAVASPLDQALHELAATSKDFGGGIASLAKMREFHLISIAWEEVAMPPEGTPDDLAEYIEASLDFTVPTRTLLLGVKLWSSVKSKVDREATGISSTFRALTDSVTRAIGQDVPDMADYEDDRLRVERMLHKFRAKVPTRVQRKQLESWFNDGRGADVEIYRGRDMLLVDQTDRLEFSSVLAFEQESLESPNTQWALDAFTHPAGTSVISVRGRLQPNKVARARVRKSIRKFRAQQEEEAATSDIDKPEFEQGMAQAQQVEDWILNSGAPMVTDCSIVFGRKVVDVESPETFIDELRERYGIIVKTLDWRQLDALDECMPCSTKRTGHPFFQDVSISVLAYAGLQGFTNLGDPTGVYVGLGDPDWAPVYLNPLGAPLADMPAAMAILGNSGSGKTYMLQHLTSQAALAGMKVVFINPKPMDDLSPTVDMVRKAGKPGSVVHLSRLEKMGGFFDPFRFTTPEQAAELAASHILGVLTEFDQKQQIDLGYHLKRAAVRGARCVKDALDLVDPDVRELVLRLAEASSLFALGIGYEPQERLDAQDGFTLIQFDRKLDIPEESTADQASYTQSQKIALAALRLITTASLEMLISGGGGMLVIDEAHHYLASPLGRRQLQSLGREGRSQGLLPVFATQRISDLVGHDLESYVSRWWCGQLTERSEAEAALRLCGLLPTEERLAWLADCGPKRSEDGLPARPSMFLHKDLKSRHAAVLIGPTPPVAHEAFSTNPADRKRRQDVADAAKAAEVPGQGAGDDLVGPIEAPRAATVTFAEDGVPLVTIFDEPVDTSEHPDWEGAAEVAAAFPLEAAAPAPSIGLDGWVTLDDSESLDQVRARHERDAD